MKKTVITGGAGFIGINLAYALARRGRTIVLYDNLSRPGCERNLAWLRSLHLPGVRFVKGDIRDDRTLRRAISGAGMVYHLAAQVAVTTSVQNPREDFSINAGGTLAVLEACRTCAPDAGLIFASTNKVYGALTGMPVRKLKTRYDFAGNRQAVGEDTPLDFHSPYGCSKGAADQYVRDYHRIYGLRTVVFRQSCIYGPHQYGNEDQGWVAHFLIRAALDLPLTIYGDGRQVRDLLAVPDLIRAYLAAERRLDRLAGSVYNIGGGRENAISLLEFLDLITQMLGKRARYAFSDWRPGDQRIFISDNSAFHRATGWKPAVGVDEGCRLLLRWLTGHLDDIRRAHRQLSNGRNP